MERARVQAREHVCEVPFFLHCESLSGCCLALADTCDRVPFYTSWKLFAQAATPEDIDEDAQDSQSSSKKAADDDEATQREVRHGRVGLALQALWDEADSAQQLSVLVDYLLLDHSEDAEHKHRLPRVLLVQAGGVRGTL